MNQTENYKLNLPEEEEFYSIEVQNENAETIDKELKRVDELADTHEKEFKDHTDNKTIHITNTERINWNQKQNAIIDILNYASYDVTKFTIIDYPEAWMVGTNLVFLRFNMYLIGERQSGIVKILKLSPSYLNPDMGNTNPMGEDLSFPIVIGYKPAILYYNSKIDSFFINEEDYNNNTGDMIQANIIYKI